MYRYHREREKKSTTYWYTVQDERGLSTRRVKNRKKTVPCTQKEKQNLHEKRAVHTKPVLSKRTKRQGKQHQHIQVAFFSPVHTEARCFRADERAHAFFFYRPQRLIPTALLFCFFGDAPRLSLLIYVPWHALTVSLNFLLIDVGHHSDKKRCHYRKPSPLHVCGVSKTGDDWLHDKTRTKINKSVLTDACMVNTLKT